MPAASSSVARAVSEDADISIRLLENHWVNIRAGRSNTKMVGMARSNFPSLPGFPNAGIVKNPRIVAASNRRRRAHPGTICFVDFIHIFKPRGR